MKKRRLFLLLSLLSLVVPLTVTAPSFSARAEEVTSEIEYEDTSESQGIRRTYKNLDIATIHEDFRAPSGCILTLKEDKESLTKLKDNIKEIELFKDDTTFAMVDIILYRKLGDSEMYSESQPTWSVPIDTFDDFLEENISKLELYEIKEKISDVDISAKLEIAIYSSDYENDVDHYTLVFNVDTYHVKKYENGDILNLKVAYYRSGDENRCNILATYTENMFNSKYGFKTDGRTEIEWEPGTYNEVYTITYYAKETNLILYTYNSDEALSGIELWNIPLEPLYVYAVMNFKQSGVEYTFYSNEIEIVEKFTGILIDGYNNRDYIGKGETHTLSLAANFDYESVYSLSISLTIGEEESLLCNTYCSPEYIEDNGEFEGDEDSGLYFTLTDDFFKFDFMREESGEYVIDAMIMLEGDDYDYYSMFSTFTIKVSNEPTNYTPLDEALTLNYTGRIDCVAGGTSFDIESSIAEDVINGNDEPIFTWNVSRLNVIEIAENDNIATINALSGGVVTVTVTCTTKVFGSISQSVVVNVIDDIYSITKLSVPDEFHYSGQDLTIGLNIEKYTNLINFTPEWVVVNKNNEEVPYIDNGNCSITIKEPGQSDYTVTVLYNGVEIDSVTIEVRTINTDKFIKQNLVWIVLITLFFVGIVIALKVLLDRKGTLYQRMAKTYKKFENIDRNSALIEKELTGIKNSIIADIEYAKSLNIYSLNEYEKTIRYLSKSLTSIREIIKDKATMTFDQYNEIYDKLCKDFKKAVLVAKEIEDAKALSLSNSLKANENNITKVQDDKNK